MRPVLIKFVLAILVLTFTSCSIIRALRTDGKDGPNVFSYQKREVDTIANGQQTFLFPVGKRADWIDMSNWSN